MKTLRIIRTTLLILMLIGPAAAQAEIEWQNLRDLKLPSAPLDIATGDEDGKVFVLLDRGEVRIYNPDGSLADKLSLGGSADRLTVSPDGRRLMLGDGESGQVRLIALEYVKSIDISGSPFKGPADADVVVAVYSDFQ